MGRKLLVACLHSEEEEGWIKKRGGENSPVLTAMHCRRRRTVRKGRLCCEI